MSRDLYRGFDARQLTLQYSPAMTVCGAAGEPVRWARQSAAFREGFGGYAALDVPYGETPGMRLDLFAPSSGGNHPVHVYIHGGYWQRTDKSDYSFLAGALVEAGACVVIVNYTLCPASTVAGIVDEVREALAWTWRHVAGHGGDPDRIHISGHSAGGHLTAMMALTRWPELAPDLPADLVKTGIPISGVFDVEPLVHTPINDPLGLDVASARALSPLLLEGAAEVPLAFAVGGDESEEFRRQSVAMAERWRSLGGEAGEVACPRRHHFNVIDDLADPQSALYGQASAFLFTR